MKYLIPGTVANAEEICIKDNLPCLIWKLGEWRILRAKAQLTYLIQLLVIMKM